MNFLDTILNGIQYTILYSYNSYMNTKNDTVPIIKKC